MQGCRHEPERSVSFVGGVDAQVCKLCGVVYMESQIARVLGDLMSGESFDAGKLPMPPLRLTASAKEVVELRAKLRDCEDEVERLRARIEEDKTRDWRWCRGCGTRAWGLGSTSGACKDGGSHDWRYDRGGEAPEAEAQAKLIWELNKLLDMADHEMGHRVASEYCSRGTDSMLDRVTRWLEALDHYLVESESKMKSGTP